MTQMFRSILVPHDLSRHSDRALGIAAELAGPRGKLTVLHVVNAYGNAPFQKKVVAEATRELDRHIAATVPKGPAIDRRIEAGTAYRHILEAARDADSIVICTAGRTGIPRFVIGSVAEKVVRHSPVPVLSFHPKQRRAATRRPRAKTS
jgi:nucleotide-binding universal stress UspA family protein